MYNALKHKKPYGAVAVGKNIQMIFPLDKKHHVKRVFVVLRHLETGIAIRQPLELTDKTSIFNFSQFAPYVSENEKLYYSNFPLSQSGIWHYRFEGELENGGIAFYGRTEEGIAVRGDWLPEWQLTVTECDYKTPNWAKSGVIYHAFADRFACKECNKFLKKGRLHTDWNDLPEVEVEGKDYQADDFFGGNIKGILSKLDYLKSLGVSCLYLSPIFEASSNHRYDTGDYLKIDELFGDEKEFADLIERAKQKGINIMLDGVFNHTGADSLYFNKFGNYPTLGAFQSQSSPYYDWYTFYEFPNKYHCWWGSTVVPTVNKSAKGFKQLILGDNGVIDKWTKAGVKGWRLDVVDELPVDFTTELCRKIKSVDNDCLIIGEVWEDASTKVSYSKWRPYFMGKQLDGVMNYPFKEAVLKFILDGHILDFKAKVSKILEHYPKESADVMMNLIGTHDTVRALTYLSNVALPEKKSDRAVFKLNQADKYLAVKRLKMAAVLQYTLTGVPSLYYGDEAGIEGFEDPMNRATYPWGKENLELLDFYKMLGKMRTDFKLEFQGELQFEKADCLCYSRNSERGRIVVFANNSDKQYCYDKKAFSVLENKVVENIVIEKFCAKVFYFEK